MASSSVVPATASKINAEMSFVPVSRAGERRWTKAAKPSALEVVSPGPKRRASDRPSNSRRIQRFLHASWPNRALEPTAASALRLLDALVALLLGGGSARALGPQKKSRLAYGRHANLGKASSSLTAFQRSTWRRVARLQ